MKYIIIILLLCNSLSARENIYGIRYDYLLHYETGMIMSIALQEWTHNTFYSIGIPTLCAGLKEYNDYRIYKEYDYKDFGYSVLGATSGRFLCLTF